ncbi:MAG: bifunctional folylpolyglutamate synthase/dihydrofolate synthase [Cyanobacterium sp. T60_A2020_053]|nr:bifunctional folylpolyglutamate synthase/dihydrofolate synthase [Cyanobacterium sp. T60_A2020_053]
MFDQEAKINDLLQPFQKFGINLGLSRIKTLLKDLDNPEQKVPFIHVAGTNGKGSVCAYLSSILTEAGYKTARFTSPHLVSWTERITINNQPISYEKLAELLMLINDKIKQRIAENDPNYEIPTQFEIITAVAWLYFAQSKVDIAVMEVGLGGRLDATNVNDNPLVSVITSISREHWQRLGDTLGKIAGEKAGVIKAQRPIVAGKLPAEAEAVVKEKSSALHSPCRWVEPAQMISLAPRRAIYQGFEYPLMLQGDIQLQNSALALEVIKVLQSQGWGISTEAIRKGMEEVRWAGRMEWRQWQGVDILIDGAHNVASAEVLRHYVDSLPNPIIWVMGMLSTKDHQGIFEAILQPQNHLILVPVPDHSSALPLDLAPLASQICPNLATVETKDDLFLGLRRALDLKQKTQGTIVLCGSLYLLGHFLKIQGVKS